MLCTVPILTRSRHIQHSLELYRVTVHNSTNFIHYNCPWLTKPYYSALFYIYLAQLHHIMFILVKSSVGGPPPPKKKVRGYPLCVFLVGREISVLQFFIRFILCIREVTTNTGVGFVSSQHAPDQRSEADIVPYYTMQYWYNMILDHSLGT